MAPPSQLAIATSAVNRLVKEEASYHKELEHQQARIEKLKQASSDEENAEWNLKQEVCVPDQVLLDNLVDNM
jgi:tubulin-specific chaperone A